MAVRFVVGRPFSASDAVRLWGPGVIMRRLARSIRAFVDAIIEMLPWLFYWPP